ncbi:MAG: polyphenol oxidase family protein, partial [Candidatus Promineifilaceae bacterium]|nr:polyphenol oxidase family protein [Candidatus Promineifilaceae bacterium]
MEFDRVGEVPFFRFRSFGAAEKQQHAVFTRHGGISPAPFASLNLSVSVPDEKGNVYANRVRAYRIYGRDTNTVVHAHLVHGAAVARVTQANNGTWIPHVDGIVTDEPGCALSMNFADCAPILIYDPQAYAIALGHAGWQGAIRDLPGALVRAMEQEFGSDPATLLAAVGPAIGPCCYEVGEPVISAVHEAFPDGDGLLHDVAGPRPHFDLPGANRRNLERAGVRQIEMAGLCTSCRSDLFF